jgi:hypothetical protein
MKLRGDQLHCLGFDSLSGQILIAQESRGEISKTRLTLLLTVLKTEGGRQRGEGNGIEAPSFCKVIVAITRSFGRSGHRAPCEVYHLLAPADGRDLGFGQSEALDQPIKPTAPAAMLISRTVEGRWK